MGTILSLQTEREKPTLFSFASGTILAIQITSGIQNYFHLSDSVMLVGIVAYLIIILTAMKLCNIIKV